MLRRGATGRPTASGAGCFASPAIWRAAACGAAGSCAGFAVQEALGRLPDRQRQAVVLRRYQGLSYREIADALDTTEAAVESLLQRAAMALRKDLAGRVEPE
jgi:predicted RNA polymerase sigma factor